MVQVRMIGGVYPFVALGLLLGCTEVNVAPGSEGSQSSELSPNPSYEWSEEEIREAISTARAGRSLQPSRWPDGGKVAVSFSFDVDNETIPLRNGICLSNIDLQNLIWIKINQFSKLKDFLQFIG